MTGCLKQIFRSVKIETQTPVVLVDEVVVKIPLYVYFGYLNMLNMSQSVNSETMSSNCSCCGSVSCRDVFPLVPDE